MRLFSAAKHDYPAPETIALSDSWSVIEAQYGAHRLIGNLRDGVAPLIGHSAYPHQAGIVLLLNQPHEDGMPGPQESEQIYALEDAIQDKIEAGNHSLLVAKWFVQGCRELVLYTMDVKEMTRRLDEIVVNGTLNEIQLNTRKDAQWKVLQAVAAKPAA